MKVAFESGAFTDFMEWSQHDRKTHQRIASLIMDILRNPFTGLGKPEPLKHELKGYWSRRIDQEHRLVYRIEGDAVIIVACKYHYEK